MACAQPDPNTTDAILRKYYSTLLVSTPVTWTKNNDPGLMKLASAKGSHLVQQSVDGRRLDSRC